MKSRFSTDQVAAILKQARSGTPVVKLCEEHGMSHVTFYRWRSKAKVSDTFAPAGVVAAVAPVEHSAAQ